MEVSVSSSVSSKSVLQVPLTRLLVSMVDQGAHTSSEPVTNNLRDSAVSNIDQSLLYTGSENGKLLALRNLITSGNLPYPSLIFTQSIERADELHQALALEGMRVDVVHGNKAKGKRDEAIKEFREGRVWCLVVTEVLARGMDFRGVKVVVNYGESMSRPTTDRRW
jgi:ATP-dependent RNA helicase DDX52/ROK1